ncbi:MAG: 4-hydroxy-tetrahydrodipicolinate reductase, partial [Actinomycetota bacterium]|nr:4-hydroxy-tetrahydrodipicolinate reductase [Actinomycetota bacterium]
MNANRSRPVGVAVSGAGGRMGRLVAAAISGDDRFELGALYDPAHPGLKIDDVVVSDDPASVTGCDTVVEFTRPDVVMTNLRRWRDLGVNAVVGTSGFDAARIEEVRSFWGTGPPNCLIVPNFSIGAVMMMRLAEIAAPHFAAAEIIELHHDKKADAPSGTAIATADRIAAAAEQHRAVESVELIPGARGADASGVPIHAVRLPGFVAHQEVILGGVGETLTVRHDTTDRAAFMPGVLL